MIAQSWTEVWVAIRDALRDARVSEESYPEVVFLRSLEQRGLTILPLEIRRMADLFGLRRSLRPRAGISRSERRTGACMP